MKEQKVIYEKHPVSPERKAELRAEGYKIIDARFAPKRSLRNDGPTVEEFVAAGYLAVNYPPEGYAPRSLDVEIAAAIAAQEDGGSLTDEQERTSLMATLTEQGIEFDEAMPTDELRALTITPKIELDGLDALEAEQLHALAKERGIKVHHAAGADKVREALRGATGE